MALTITDKMIRGASTRHTASSTGDGWIVTWLPAHVLTRRQAAIAMAIAEAVSDGVGLSDDPVWPQLDKWAAELGLTGPDALVRVSERPADDPETRR
jgi:hypothetical protein